MPFTAGQKLRASDLNKIQPTIYTAQQSGNAGAQQAITTSEADCLNCSVTFTTLTAATCEIVATWDVDVATGGAAIALGRVRVDGVTIANEAHFSIVTTSSRTTMTKSWKFSVAGAGSHTVIQRVLKNAAAGTANCDDQHTGFTLSVLEVL